MNKSPSSQAERLDLVGGYEWVLKNLLDLQEQAAKSAGADWASTLASTHANFVRDTSEVFFSAMRQQLKS